MYIVVVPDVQRTRELAIHPQAMPLTKVEFADEANLQLKRELLEVCRREHAADRERERHMQLAAALAEQHESSRIQAGGAMHG